MTKPSAFREARELARASLAGLCSRGRAAFACLALLISAAVSFPAASEPIASELVITPPGVNSIDEYVPPKTEDTRWTIDAEGKEDIEARTGTAKPRTPTIVNNGLSIDDPYSLYMPAVIRVGIQQSVSAFPVTPDRSFLARTRQEIRRAFENQEVDFRVLSRGDLASAARSGEVDFVIGDADLVAQLQMECSLKLLASLWPSESRDVNSASSAVFFTRAESLDIQSFAHLGDHPVAAANPASFSGYTLPLYELSRRGFGGGYMTELYFSGSYENVVRDVISGKAGAGLLPACILESLERAGIASMGNFRIINPRRVNELRCAHSTDVFPSLAVASLPKTDPVMEKTFAAALLGMPHAGDQAQWSLPASMQKIFDVYYELKIGPYQYLAQWSLQRFMREHAAIVAFIAVLALMILSYAAVLQAMVKKRTAALRQVIADRERIEEEVSASREHISALERTGIIGQMSSMIAHELKQPLGAINNFGNGLLRRVKRGQLDPKVLAETLEDIVGQGTRASEIVDRVRGYAKHPDPIMQVCDMVPVLEKAINEFKHIHPEAPHILLKCLPYSWAEVDAWEIQLAVLNLLKNASEALQGCPDPEIIVRLREKDGKWRLTVEDNGREIAREKTDLFFEPLYTGKMTGMGLGLSIVANIAERHKGHVSAEPNEALGHGCVMVMVLPIAKSPLLEAEAKARASR